MGIPKKLWQAIRLRKRALFALRESCFSRFDWRVMVHAKRVVALDSYIQRREWLRNESVDWIALGM